MTYTEAVSEHGSQRAAARALGIPESTLRDRLRKEIAERTEADAPLDPLVITGTSTLYNKDGEVIAEWVKKNLDRNLEGQAREAAIRAMAAIIKPVAPLPGPATTLAKLLTLYNFFDYHVGMLAWHKEGGADWDLKIAEEVGTSAMQMLVDGAPASAVGMINIGGDFLHFDGLLPITPTHGHVLDADGRFSKVIDVAIKLIRRLVDLALQKHGTVHLLIMEGNHDLTSSLWLRKMFALLYADNPRVTVQEGELPYYAYQHGQTMLGFHHGHMKKNESLPALFAAMFRQMWGQVTKCYIHTGHRHHLDQKDHPGARVIQHPTLAAMDAHAARHGYFSDREITATTYHRETGQVGSNTVTPEMLGS